MQENSSRDFLLQLPGKAASLKACQQWIDQKDSFFVLLADIDDFFEPFKAHGPVFCQELLGKMAKELSRLLPSESFLGWMESDEFLILLPGPVDSKKFLDRLMLQVKNQFEHQKKVFEMNLSIGVSLYPKEGAYSKDLLQKASLAKYQAKETKAKHSYYSFLE